MLTKDRCAVLTSRSLKRFTPMALPVARVSGPLPPGSSPSWSAQQTRSCRVIENAPNTSPSLNYVPSNCSRCLPAKFGPKPPPPKASSALQTSMPHTPTLSTNWQPPSTKTCPPPSNALASWANWIWLIYYSAIISSRPLHPKLQPRASDPLRSRFRMLAVLAITQPNHRPPNPRCPLVQSSLSLAPRYPPPNRPSPSSLPPIRAGFASIKRCRWWSAVTTAKLSSFWTSPLVPTLINPNTISSGALPIKKPAISP